MSDMIGKSIDRYHILEQLGEGGMATVYKAFDTRLERDVAVKIIRRNAFPPDQLDRILKRFEREAKSLARLSHPNIIKVIDYGEYNGAPYLVMEYMPGGTLKEKLKGKAMQWQEAVRLLIPIAQALEYAHEQKIIHRDLKPSNILLMQKGQPMLTDFGIAKILEVEETATLTGTGVGVGTPEYMAPEQWTGSATAQTDIYSLGVVLYEMVTGRKPYTADTPAAILLKQATEPLPRPGTYVSDLPDSVEKILLKALARKPQDRYQDTGAFVTAMENLLMGTGQKPISTPSVRKPIEPDLETQDTYIQEETTSTKSQTGTYTDAPRKTRTTQTINPVVFSQPKKTVWWPWVVGGIGLILAAIAFSNPNLFVPAVTQAPASVAMEAPIATEASIAAETPFVTEIPIATEVSTELNKDLLAMYAPNAVGDYIHTAGSSTMFPISERMAELFQMEGYTGYIIVDSIGTGAGFKRFCVDGESDISTASRSIKKSEKEACIAIGREPLEFRIATDALTIVVSTENDFLTALTKEQLAKIYSGEFTTWDQVDVTYPAEYIDIYSPGIDSGSFDYFIEAIVSSLFKNAEGKADLVAAEAALLGRAGAQFSEDDNILVQGVKDNRYAIGYFGYAYFAENTSTLKALAIEGVKPSKATVNNMSYPLVRPLFIYSTAEIMQEKPQVAAFIYFYLSNINDIIMDDGYFPASAADLQRAIDAWVSTVRK